MNNVVVRTNPITDFGCFRELVDEPEGHVLVAQEDGFVQQAVTLVVLGDGQLTPRQGGLQFLQVVVDHAFMDVLDFSLRVTRVIIL